VKSSPATEPLFDRVGNSFMKPGSAYAILAFAVLGSALGFMNTRLQLIVTAAFIAVLACLYLVEKPLVMFFLVIAIISFPDLIPLSGVTNTNLLIPLLILVVMAKEMSRSDRRDFTLRISTPGLLFIIFGILAGFYIFPTYLKVPFSLGPIFKTWLLFVLGMSIHFLSLYFVRDRKTLNSVIKIVIVVAFVIAIINIIIIVAYATSIGSLELYRIRRMMYDPIVGIRFMFDSYGNTNVVGCFISYVTSFLMGFSFVYRKSWKYTVFLLPILLVSVYLLASRSALLGVFLPFGVIIVYHLGQKRTIKWVNTTHVLALLLVALGLVLFLVPPEYNIIRYTFQDGGVDNSVMFRLRALTDSLKLIINNPMGIGFMAFGSRQVWMHDVSYPFLSSSQSHNSYLDFIMNTGIIGFMVIITAFVLVLKKAHTVLKNAGSDMFLKAVALGSFCSLFSVMVVFLTGMQYLYITFMGFFWLFSSFPYKIEEFLSDGGS